VSGVAAVLQPQVTQDVWGRVYNYYQLQPPPPPPPPRYGHPESVAPILPCLSVQLHCAHVRPASVTITATLPLCSVGHLLPSCLSWPCTDMRSIATQATAATKPHTWHHYSSVLACRSKGTATTLMRLRHRPLSSCTQPGLGCASHAVVLCSECSYVQPSQPQTPPPARPPSCSRWQCTTTVPRATGRTCPPCAVTMLLSHAHPLLGAHAVPSYSAAHLPTPPPPS
jgi:hypothetical protein